MIFFTMSGKRDINAFSLDSTRKSRGKIVFVKGESRKFSEENCSATCFMSFMVYNVHTYMCVYGCTNKEFKT